MADKIKLRRDTQANWEAVNPILDAGELGLITDRSTAKIGDGSTNFNDLPLIHAKMDEWINVEDFGAKGDGVTDDTLAFQAISDYVNAKGYGIINFGYNKVYRLGRQTFTGVADGAAYAGQPMLNFENCNLLIINGNGSTLKLNDGLHYGSFDPVTGEVYNPPAGGFTNWDYSASIGSIINISNSKIVKISNLKIDGNNENLVIGGYWGDNGIQLDASGITLLYVSNIILENVNSSYNGHDGLYHRCDVNQFGTLIINSKFEYNGRQGCSITGGNNIKFINTTFSNTGQGAVFSSPGAGCDIEPNTGDFAQSIKFENCLFENNKGVGLISAVTSAKNIKVDNSEFWQSFTNSSDAFWFNGPKRVKISNSLIHGCITNFSVDDGIVENCKIDDAFHPIYGQSGIDRNALFSNGGGSFINCSFERTYPHYITAVEGNTNFINCNFIYKGDYPYADNRIGIIRNVYIQNCTFQDDIPNKTKYFHYLDDNTKFFNSRNLGPNVSVRGIINGEIPSDTNTVWKSGNTRPADPQTGQRFFDTTLGKPIWFNGTNWVDATGIAV